MDIGMKAAFAALREHVAALAAAPRQTPPLMRAEAAAFQACELLILGLPHQAQAAAREAVRLRKEGEQ